MPPTMLERDDYDHVTPEGEAPIERFLAGEENCWGFSGENIATCEGCPTSPDEARVRALLRALSFGWRLGIA